MPPTDSPPPATERFEAIAAQLQAADGVSRKTSRGFARLGLFRRGRLFATLRGEELLLKLDAAQVAALVASGLARPFEGSRGRVMREWALVSAEADWEGLARDAAAHAA